MVEKCGRCWIEFEPKTPKIVRSEYPTKIYWHVGCWAAQRYANNHRTKVCSHCTPAEDSSRWAFAHRTWGCPDEGAVWPHGYEEMAMHD